MKLEYQRILVEKQEENDKIVIKLNKTQDESEIQRKSKLILLYMYFLITNLCLNYF